MSVFRFDIGEEVLVFFDAGMWLEGKVFAREYSSVDGPRYCVGPIPRDPNVEVGTGSWFKESDLGALAKPSKLDDTATCQPSDESEALKMTEFRFNIGDEVFVPFGSGWIKGIVVARQAVPAGESHRESFYTVVDEFRRYVLYHGYGIYYTESSLRPAGDMPATPSAEPARKPSPPDGMDDWECEAYQGLVAAQRLAHQTASDAGWYSDPATGEPIKRNFGEVVALMHSELSEALESDRKGLMDDKLPHLDGRAVEFADCIIRILDTAEALGLDVAGALIEKNRYNKSRADHKLENRANGGKKY